jgi:hypothetical protein
VGEGGSFDTPPLQVLTVGVELMIHDIESILIYRNAASLTHINAAS